MPEEVCEISIMRQDIPLESLVVFIFYEPTDNFDVWVISWVLMLAVLCCWLSWPLTVVRHSGERKLTYIIMVPVHNFLVEYGHCNVKKTYENVLNSVVKVTTGSWVLLAIRYMFLMLVILLCLSDIYKYKYQSDIYKYKYQFDIYKHKYQSNHNCFIIKQLWFDWYFMFVYIPYLAARLDFGLCDGRNVNSYLGWIHI